MTYPVHISRLDDFNNVPQCDLELENRQEILYQRDSRPGHFSRAGTRLLNDKFPNRWIGQNGHTICPPRSPDLIATDFFYLDSLKKYSLRTTDNTRKHERIIN